MKNVAPLLFMLGCSCWPMCGCTRHQARPSITAVGLSPANRGEPCGIPYYLPKPLLVIAKNARHIDESKVGVSQPAPIPGGFDNQATYADIKANVTVPSNDERGLKAAEIAQARVPDAATVKATLAKNQEKSFEKEHMTPSGNVQGDELQPDSFYTYQIVFVPDLTQKYGLRISGGAGEIRAAMNMVNGWMYTGMGPYYLKDSSSAQNAMSTGAASMYAGRGVSSVLDSVGNLASTIGAAAARNESALTDEQTRELSEELKMLESLATSTPRIPQSMLNYSEIYIYEPALQGGDTQWNLVAEHHFDRHYLEDSEAGRQVRQEMFDLLLKQASGGALPSAPGASAPGAPAAPGTRSVPAPTKPVPTVPPAQPPAQNGSVNRERVPAPVSEPTHNSSRRNNSVPKLGQEQLNQLDLTTHAG